MFTPASISLRSLQHQACLPSDLSSPAGASTWGGIYILGILPAFGGPCRSRVGEGGSRGPGQAVALWLVSGQRCGPPSVTFWPSFPLGDLAAFGRLVGGLSARLPWAAATLGLWNHGSWKRLFSSALSGKAHVRGLCD